MTETFLFVRLGEGEVYRNVVWKLQVVGLTPGQVAIKWLVPGWVTVCGQVNHLGI